MTTERRPVRWGLLGTGKITRKLLAGAAGARSTEVVAVGSRDGDLNRFVNAFLNDTDVRHLQALDTPVGEADTLVLLPAMAGG